MEVVGDVVVVWRGLVVVAAVAARLHRQNRRGDQISSSPKVYSLLIFFLNDVACYRLL